jgi:radical SAM protein
MQQPVIRDKPHPVFICDLLARLVPRHSATNSAGTAIAQLRRMPLVYDTPQRIYWELTRACDLACSHCRANADASANPHELNTLEVYRVLEEIAAECKPQIILTGGDPLKRRDFFDIVKHTVDVGLACLVAPSATPLLTRAVIDDLASLRVAAMSLSLDGASAETHDTLRGVDGTFDHTLKIARRIVEDGIPLQINTLVTADTIRELPAIHRVVQQIGAARWSLFFLIKTGRGARLRQIEPEQSEAILTWALEHALDQRPVITTTEAPHFRRIAAMRRAEHVGPASGRMRGLGIRDGNGVMFISHTGDVQPSGFLPLTAGNARTENPLWIYRNSPLFQDLRRSDRFSGRCGCCEFREICGGSRARAYATTGDPLGADPLCGYMPQAAIDYQAASRD